MNPALPFFIFSFVCLIMLIALVSYASNQTAKFYENSLNLVDAKCVLMCRYRGDLLSLKQNAPCYLFADDEKVTIIPVEMTETQIPLYLAKITSFQHAYKGSNNSLAGSNLPGTNNIIISYISEDEDIKELTFSLMLTAGEIKFNKYAISKCNINEFVNQRISKQESTIKL